MSKLRVHCFSVSIDGYGAGPNQDLANPLGVGGLALHEWFFATRTFRRMHGKEGGTTGVDEDFAARGFENIGAWILGRNMFGPVRGPWPDEHVEGMVGRQPALPHASLRAHQPPAGVPHHGRGNHVPLCHGRHPCRLGASPGGRRPPRHPARRRSRDPEAIPSRQAHRRDALGPRPRAAWLRGASSVRHGLAEARLPMHPVPSDAAVCDARPPQKAAVGRRPPRRASSARGFEGVPFDLPRGGDCRPGVFRSVTSPHLRADGPA